MIAMQTKTLGCQLTYLRKQENKYICKSVQIDISYVAAFVMLGDILQGIF